MSLNIPTVANKLNMPRRKLKEGLLGVEVEVEGEGLPFVDDDDWRTEQDHSLRGESYEYVMREPRSLEETETCLNSLANRLSDSTYYETPRAGVHVHVNVQDLNVVQLFNVITATYLLETILTKYCGSHREGNLFCLRVSDASYQAMVVKRAAESHNLGVFNNDMIRYSALNLTSLHKYGSIEYRAMRSTSDFNVIKVWCNVLANIRKESSTFDTPLDVVSMALRAPESFAYKMLGSCAGEMLEGVNVVEEINTGLDYVIEYANTIDWSGFEERMIGGLSFPANIEYPDEPLGDY